MLMLLVLGHTLRSKALQDIDVQKRERAGEVVVREGWACGKVPLVHLGAMGVPINAQMHHGGCVGGT